MPDLGRLIHFIQDAEGDLVSGATVAIRKQGASVSGTNSGTTPLTVNILPGDLGGIIAGDTVEFYRGSTRQSSSGGSSTFNVDAITNTTVVVSGFSGTLSLEDDDRITPTTNLPSLYNDAQENESLVGGNPTTSDAGGAANAWLRAGPYDLLQSGTGINTRLEQDVWVVGNFEMINTLWTGSAIAKQWRLLRSGNAGGDRILRVLNSAGAEIYAITGAGGVVASTGSFSDTVTISAGGLTVSAGGITVTGNSTFNNNLTVTGSASLNGGGALAGTFTGTPTLSGAVVLSGTGNVALGALLRATQTQTIASAGSINVSTATIRVLLTGSTTVSTININGAGPGSGDDGRILILVNSDAGGITVDNAGNVIPGTAGGDTIAASGGAMMVIWNNSVGKWASIVPS